MKILVVIDTWYPQINGVIRTWENVIKILKEKHEIKLIVPSDFATVPCPSYPEYRVALFPGKKIRKTLEAFRPDAVHLCNEGPLGLSAMFHCQKLKIPFTSSFHTRFPEYIQERWGVPADVLYAISRSFHKAAVRTLVPTPSSKASLEEKGFKNLVLWTRGIDRSLFHPDQNKLRKMRSKYKKNLLYVGRVAPEKNVEAFCALSKNKDYQCFVVGDGPQRKELQKKWKKVKFVGYKRGQKLAEYYANADVSVFTSSTDTFGITIIESIACGTPVAGFPVIGPQDIIVQGKSGYVDEDLEKAVENCLTLKSADLPQYVEEYKWENCARILEENLEIIDWQKAKTKPLSPSS